MLSLLHPGRPPGDQGIYDEIFRQEVYEQRHTLRPTDIVLDIGAHAGFFTWKAAQVVKHVFSFEPSPDNFSALVTNCQKLANVDLMNTALGSYRHDAELGWSSNNSGGHSLYQNKFNQHDRTYKVTVRRLDDLFPDARYRRVTFVKIDAEGAEAEIIRGGYELIATWLPPFAMELHSRELYTEVRGLLEPLGYTLYDTDLEGRSTFGSYGMVYAEVVK